MTENIDFLIATLRDLSNRMKYTYKVHEKTADRFQRYENWRKLILVMLTAVTTGSSIASIFDFLGYAAIGQFISAGLAISAAFASLLGDYFDFKEKVRLHVVAGTKTREFFISYELIIADLLDGAITQEEARRRRNLLAKQEKSLLVDLPRTSRKDYNKAEESLETNEKPSSFLEELLSKLQ